ncbi:hypothetical protein [Roseisalinus antarcticus]|nr:hypothetical protein [Roseisalinus antarcticus]
MSVLTCTAQGRIRDRAIEGAADMAAEVVGDLNSSTLQLAIALEDPVSGLGEDWRDGRLIDAMILARLFRLNQARA